MTVPQSWNFHNYWENSKFEKVCVFIVKKKYFNPIILLEL